MGNPERLHDQMRNAAAVVNPALAAQLDQQSSMIRDVMGDRPVPRTGREADIAFGAIVMYRTMLDLNAKAHDPHSVATAITSWWILNSVTETVT